MRRTRSQQVARTARVVAVGACLAIAATACGVAADTTAATVAGQTISIDDVNAVIDEKALVGEPPEELNESRQPGDLARAALLYELRRVVWVNEAERWGVEPSAEELEAAGAAIDQELTTAQLTLGDETRRGAIAQAAAQQNLLRRLATIDPESEEDLRLVYDASPNRFDQVCMTVVRVTPDLRTDVDAELDDGAELDELPDLISEAEVLATPDQCLAEGELPVELLRAIDSPTLGSRPSSITIASGSGEAEIFFHVDSRRSSSFADAREQVAQIASTLARAVEQLQAIGELPADADESTVQEAQSAAQQAQVFIVDWIEQQVKSAEINPRYGSGVTSVESQTGSQLIIEPPPVPELPLGSLLPGDGSGLQLDPSQVEDGSTGSTSGS